MNQNDLEDWTLVDIIHLDSIRNISESIDNIHTDSDNSIDQRDFYGSSITLVENEIILQNSISMSKSYREALLCRPEIQNEPKLFKNEYEQNQVATIKSNWKPTIIIEKIKNERKDRLYQHNISSHFMYTFEDEDEYDSYFQSNEFIKGRVGMARNRSITMLTPSQMEKKQQRIAAKS